MSQERPVLTKSYSPFREMLSATAQNFRVNGTSRQKSLEERNDLARQKISLGFHNETRSTRYSIHPLSEAPHEALKTANPSTVPRVRSLTCDTTRNAHCCASSRDCTRCIAQEPAPPASRFCASCRSKSTHPRERFERDSFALSS